MPVLFSTTTTAQSIMNQTAQDVRQTLSGVNPPDSTVLLDYCNRISLEMLSTSKWIFLLSGPQYFITQQGVTNYWIGPTGSAPLNAFDTFLNITNLRTIKDQTVFDRSNFRQLGHADNLPVVTQLTYPNANSRPGRPREWRQNQSTPNILNIYPAPDNQNTFQPVPESPIFSAVAGGSLGNRYYFVAVTLVDTVGNESTPSPASQVFLYPNNLLVVKPPSDPLGFADQNQSSAQVQYNRYNVYAASAGTNNQNIIDVSQLTLQASNISVGSTWTEPGTGLTTTGVNPPSTNNVQPLGGYVIEFQFYSQRIQLTSAAQVIQVPDDYRHVFVAGVNALAFMYLTRPQEALRWYSIYQDGLVKIVRDINFLARGPGYFQVDSAATGNTLQDVETLDLGFLVP